MLIIRLIIMCLPSEPRREASSEAPQTRPVPPSVTAAWFTNVVLSVSRPQATNLITKKELLTVDPDTDDEQLIYEVTTAPRHGFLESKLKPGNPVTTFTQGTWYVCPQPLGCSVAC